MNCEPAKLILDGIEADVQEIQSVIRNDQAKNSRLQTFLALYLISKLNGAFEQSIEYIIFQKVVQEGMPNYVKILFGERLNEYFRNPTSVNVETLLNKCDESWFCEIKNKIHESNHISEESFKSLDNIVEHKNDLVHTSSTSQVSVLDAIQWYNKAKIIIEVMDDHLLNTSR